MRMNALFPTALKEVDLPAYIQGKAKPQQLPRRRQPDVLRRWSYVNGNCLDGHDGQNPPSYKGGVRQGISVLITTVSDLVAARKQGRELARNLGFSLQESILVTATITELARNIVLYAKAGVVRLAPIRKANRVGILIIASDRGPGIRNVERALLGGYSTSGGLGLGCSGVRHIVDELHVDSGVGRGTTITAMKWHRG